MTTVLWDQLAERSFESGLDRGVLYFPEGGGVAWNGLISVDEQSNASVRPVYYDGVKFNDIVVPGEFSATMRAYTYPDEFLEFEGIVEEQTGVFVADQPQKIFHLSYRTMIGDGVSGLDLGYKIHLLWNLTAIPSTKTYETLSLDPDPSEFEWSLTSVPEAIDKYRPTAHLIIDSRKIDSMLLADIESILYGSEDKEPIMPSLKGLISFIRKWNRIIVVDNGDGTWTASSRIDGIIEMLDSTTFQINEANATYLNPTTYEIESSEKNEEDIF